MAGQTQTSNAESTRSRQWSTNKTRRNDRKNVYRKKGNRQQDYLGAIRPRVLHTRREYRINPLEEKTEKLEELYNDIIYRNETDTTTAEISFELINPPVDSLKHFGKN